MKKLVIHLIFLLLFQTSLLAYSSDPKQFINELINDAISNLSNKNLTLNEKEEFIKKISLENVDIDALTETVKSINYFRTKAKNIKKTAEILVAKYKSQVPDNRPDLMSLPGVGRKSANVVLGQIFNVPAITVDTHVKRLAFRLGLTKNSDPFKVELDLMKLWPENLWNTFSTLIIFHGRNICISRTPKCGECNLALYCLKYTKF